jgi:hypothetical protein
MRRAFFTLLGVVILALGVSSLALGAKNPKAHGTVTAKCGTRYTPRCVPPSIGGINISIRCRSAGSRISVPKFKVSAVAGIRRITVHVSGSHGYTLSINGNGNRNKTVSGLGLATRGFAPGVYTVKITVTDLKGVKRSRTLHFVICSPPPPPFTG